MNSLELSLFVVIFILLFFDIFGIEILKRLETKEENKEK